MILVTPSWDTCCNQQYLASYFVPSRRAGGRLVAGGKDILVVGLVLQHGIP